jgi:hypothetical protein
MYVIALKVKYNIAHERSRMTSSGDCHQDWEVKFNMSHIFGDDEHVQHDSSRRDQTIEACRSFGDDHVKMLLGEAFP